MKTLSIACYKWLLIGLLATHWLADPQPAWSDSPIHFDMPPTAAAVVNANDSTQVTVELKLSSMVDAAHRLKVDQWLVRCRPRDQRLALADYAPRTETSSHLSSPIQVKTTGESSNAFGASLDGGYGHLATGHMGFDSVDKKVKTLQYDQVAPHQVVVAAGTIDRGRGVYFKLRSTAHQVLEGEKCFKLTFRVPREWRGSLIDVSVEAQAEKRSFNPWERETRTVSSQHFVVAVYRAGDQQAEHVAASLADAEQALRQLNVELQTTRGGMSLSSVFRQVTMSFDSSDNLSWLQRLLLGQADPHLDEQIRDLPMNVRVAVLDYAELRDDFRQL